MKAERYLLLAVVLLAAGCTTVTNVTMQSVETKSRRTAEQLSQRRIVILPIAARIGNQQVLAPLRKGQEVFLQHTTPADRIVAGQEVDRLLADNQSLAQTYHGLVQELIDYDPNLCLAKDDIQTVVDPKGITYENIRVVCESNRYQWADSKPVLLPEAKKPAEAAPEKAKDVVLSWKLRTKNSETNRMIAPASSMKMAQALNGDYLLVPVLHDSYSYLKAWFFLGLIPLPFITTSVTPNHELSLYLIDGTTGELVRSIQISAATPVAPDSTGGVLSMAAAMQHILDRGDFMGHITPATEI